MMSVRQTRLSDVPDALLLQKPALKDLERVRLMDDIPTVFAFSFHEGEDCVAVVWMMHNQIYNQIFVDTMIIDEKYRGVTMARRIFRASASLARNVARAVGADAVTTALKARRLARSVRDAKVVGVLVRMEVN